MFQKLLPHVQIPLLDQSVEPFAQELESETVIHKSTFNGFYDTNLDQVLKGKGIKTVMGTGLVVTKCVHQTLFGAFNRGYRTILIQDACGDRSLEKM